MLATPILFCQYDQFDVLPSCRTLAVIKCHANQTFHWIEDNWTLNQQQTGCPADLLMYLVFWECIVSVFVKMFHMPDIMSTIMALLYCALLWICSCASAVTSSAHVYLYTLHNSCDGALDRGRLLDIVYHLRKIGCYLSQRYDMSYYSGYEYILAPFIQVEHFDGLFAIE